MRGQYPQVKDLDYYSTVKQIFQELSRQAGTKVPIPVAAKEVDFSIVEPLTDQEKEEDYELNLYISTFVSEDTLTVTTTRVHLTVKHPTAPVVDLPSTEQQQQTPVQTLPAVQQTVLLTPTIQQSAATDPPQTPTGEVAEDDPSMLCRAA